MHQDGVIHPVFGNHHGRGRSPSLSPSGVQTVRTPPESHQRSRHAIHVEIRKGTLSPPRNLPEHLHGLSPQNGRTVRTDEPMARAVPEILDKPQTNELGNL